MVCLRKEVAISLYDLRRRTPCVLYLLNTPSQTTTFTESCSLLIHHHHHHNNSNMRLRLRLPTLTLNSSLFRLLLLLLLRTLPLHPRKIQEPRPPVPIPRLLGPYPLIRLAAQTCVRDMAVSPNIVDQALLADVVVLGPDEAEDEQVEGRAVKVGGEGGEDVDLDAAHGVFVEGVVADGEDGLVDGACFGVG